MKTWKIGAVLLIIHAVTLNAQDTIFKTNGLYEISKIEEINATTISYRRADNTNGAMYSIPKSEVRSIHYKNGYVEKITEPTINAPSNASAKTEVDTSTQYVLSLKDGTRLKGKVIKRTQTEIIFEDKNIGQNTIPIKNVALLQPEFGMDKKIIEFTDGSIVSGKIVNQTSEYTVVKTDNLGVISIPSSKIKSIKSMQEGTVSTKGSVYFKNPNSTRYLFAPSAFQLKKNEGYYQNVYGLLNAVQYGITNHIMVGGGITGPFGAYIDCKAGFSLAKNVHIAGGVLLGNSFFEINNHNLGMVLGFGALTIGNYNHNITLEAGYGFLDNAVSSDFISHPILAINGITRIGKSFAFVTENWLVSSTKDIFAKNDGVQAAETYHLFYSYAFRYMSQRTSLDFGFANTPSLFERGWKIGVPFIGFAIRFGDYKDE
jgi:hypothetical protein